MAPTMDRSTRRELRRLGSEAQRLWEEQRDVLDHAKDVVRDASRSAGAYTKREILPRAHDAYDNTLQPLLRSVGKRVPSRKKSTGPLGYVLMALGAIALAAISYSAWNTLREDDDLWIGDESA